MARKERRGTSLPCISDQISIKRPGEIPALRCCQVLSIVLRKKEEPPYRHPLPTHHSPIPNSRCSRIHHSLAAACPFPCAAFKASNRSSGVISSHFRPATSTARR